MPALSAVWAHLVTSNTLRGMYADYSSEMMNVPRNDKKAFGILSDIHCAVAGLKAIGSW